MFPATTKKGGAHMTAGPLDVCLTPTPGGPIPIPYANMVDGLSDSGDEAARRTKVKIIEKQVALGRNPTSATQAAILSTGDEAGTRGGVISSQTHGPARFMTGTSKVKIEGVPLTFMTATTSQSASDSAPGIQLTPSQTKVIIMGN